MSFVITKNATTRTIILQTKTYFTFVANNFVSIVKNEIIPTKYASNKKINPNKSNEQSKKLKKSHTKSIPIP